MSRNLSPILLFTYKRLDTLRQTVEALKLNFLAEQSRLFIFSDAPKQDKDIDAVKAVRQYIHKINGFLNIEILESVSNKGLASSIIDGVSSVINIYGKVIVLEDDLVTSPNFLSFINQALHHYESNGKVFSVAGFSMPMKGLSGDVYFTGRSSSWGWGTWKDRWNEVDWQVNDYYQFSKDRKLRKRFNRMGSDLAGMLDKQMQGRINSWAIRWCYHQYKNGLYTVYPSRSKIANIGLESPDATHTNEKFSRFKTIRDSTGTRQFLLPDEIELEPAVIKQFVKPYSIPERVKYKLLNVFGGL